MLRHSLAAIIKARNLTVAGWCRSANIPESVLRNFLKGRSETLTFTSLFALAHAIEEPISTLLGETPSKDYDYVSIEEEINIEWRSSVRLKHEDKFIVYLPEDFRFPNIVHSGAIVRDNSADAIYPPGSIVTYVKYEDAEIDPADGDLVVMKAVEESNIVNDDAFVDNSARQLTIRKIVESRGEMWAVSCSTDPAILPPLKIPKSALFDHAEDFPYQLPPHFYDGNSSYWICGLINASYRREGPPHRTQRTSHKNAIQD